MIFLVLGLLIFLGIHSTRIFALAWREEKISTMGENKWKSIYSIVSAISLVLIVYGYSQAWQTANVIYVPFEWGRSAAIVLMLIAFCLMPFNMRSSRLKKITHHPFLAAITLWCIAHLLANGDSASVVLFGFFLVWALFCWHAASKRKGELPPVAPLVQDLAAVGFGVVIWALFLFIAHEYLFGVAPIS